MNLMDIEENISPDTVYEQAVGRYWKNQCDFVYENQHQRTSERNSETFERTRAKNKIQEYLSSGEGKRRVEKLTP